MTGIENITGRIQKDAQEQIDSILAQAQSEAQAVLAGYEARAKKESAEVLARGEQSAQERGRRLVSAAQIEAGKSTLAAKQEVLNQAFDLALSKLLKLPEKEYIELLAGLAVEASETGMETLLMNAADQKRCGEKVVALANELLVKQGKKGAMTLSSQARNIQGGLLVSDGAIEVNCALETLVRLQRSEMTGEVSRVLFG